ncbi:MAG: flagellar basal body-associated FliL family protein [Azonexus sp.]|jgi:flagellar FliL protein|uniref:flagellar basal body-associated FliL family protein n=1 Tax=Azonexus sp. TaxID=1872668 RepID=UPI00282296F0|nr:flagellar basal body-associated FliL family protein [Azonexus sp.]MDR0777730.1 flagellar basal body-associated FliL family protein [Azonexus sp.]
MAKEAKAADGGSAASPNKGKKLLIVILLLLLMLVGGGIVALKLLADNPAADEDDEYAEEVVKPKKPKKRDNSIPPVFINLDPFTVNLVPETGDQYLQVALSLELDNPASEVTLKALMPRIRNDITLLLSSKKASELMTKEGKEELALALKDEVNLAVQQQPRGKKGAPIQGPIEAVLFTSFIIQ